VTTYPVANANNGPCGQGGGGGEIHCLGEVWTHGLLDIRGALGADASGHNITDVDLIASQFLYAQDETFTQAVGHLIDADTVIYGGVHAAAICTEMVGARGVPAPPQCAPAPVPLSRALLEHPR
jgi:hypothetical protein